MRKPIIVSVDQKFGLWTVTNPFTGRDSKGNQEAECKCKCGVIRTLRVGVLVSGKSLSCRNCATPAAAVKRTRHGQSVRQYGKVPASAEYRAWNGMKDRCYNRNTKMYKYYGGRGIVVDHTWKDNFQQFLDDVGLRPSPRHSLDRYPDRNGPYAPGNVRWATLIEQNNNRRNVLQITIDGVTKGLMEWASELNLPKSTVHNRISRGWLPEKAVTTPAKPRRKKS